MGGGERLLAGTCGMEALAGSNVPQADGVLEADLIRKPNFREDDRLANSVSESG